MKSKTPNKGGLDRRLKQFAITLSSRLLNIAISKTSTDVSDNKSILNSAHLKNNQ